MRATLARVARLTAGYSLVTLAGPLFTVLLTPLYTRVLTPADYGVVEVATALGSFANTLVLLALDQALNAHFFTGDATRQRQLVTTALGMVLGLGLLMSLLLAVGAGPLARFLFDDPARRPLILLIAVSATTTPLYTLTLAALRLQTQVRRANGLALGLLLVTVTTTVTLVLGFGFKATGVVAASVLGSVCACALGLLLAWPVLGGRFAWAHAGPLLRTALTLLPGALSLLILSGADRLLLTQFVSATELGLYSTANKLAALLYVGLSAIWHAWWPLALEMAPRPEGPRQIARMLEYLTAFSLTAALGLGAFAPQILQVFTRALYVPAAPYALVLMFYTGPLTILFQMFFIGLYVRQRTHWISAAYLVAGASNVALNLWWDPLWGVWGAVWATIAAGGLLAVVAFAAGQRVYPVQYRLGRLLLLGGLYAAGVACFLLVPAANHVLAKLGAVAVMAGASVALGIVTPRELRQGWQALRGRLVSARRPQ